MVKFMTPNNFVEITSVTMPNGMSYSCNIEGCYLAQIPPVI